MKSELLRKALMAKMANGGTLGGDDKNKKTGEKQKERRVGATTGVDLMAPVRLNQDPTMLPQDVSLAGYNKFQSWLEKQKIEGKPFVGNPVLNTNEGKAKWTDWAINEFNNSQYVRDYPQNAITPESIRAIQSYHKLTDPNVQVDSMLGTQTSTMRVPEKTLYRYNPSDQDVNKGLLPVKWGNRLYVVDASKVDKTGAYNPSDLSLYDESKHFKLLQKPLAESDPYSKAYREFVPKPALISPDKKIESGLAIPKKKKGGIVARYVDGGGIGSAGVGDYNMFNIQAENPNMAEMNVSDTGMNDLSLDKNVASQGGANNKNFMGGTKWKDIKSSDKMDLASSAAPIAAGGLDTLDRKDGRSSIAGQTGVGAIKGAGKGAALGMKLGGPKGAVIGAIAGAVIGGTSGAIKGKKERKERQKPGIQSVRDANLQAQQYDPMNPNRGPVRGAAYNEKDYTKGIKALFANGGSIPFAANKPNFFNALAGGGPRGLDENKSFFELANGGSVKQLSNSANKINYATGGTIKGPGTGTSDSIVTDINGKGIPEGSFITPAKNNEMAKGIRGYILRQNPNKTAEFKKGGTTNSDKVAVSNGEHLFTPKEKKKIVNYLGEEILEKLAPEAEENNEMEKANGGNVTPADKTKVKSPNVYEGKMGSDKSKEYGITEFSRQTKRSDGTSKVEVKMPDGTWKTTYNLEKKYETVKKAQGGELSKEKAKTMLHDKKAHGKPLTDKQRKYFGWVAGGKKSMGGIIGKYANGGTMNRDWEWG